MSESVEFELLLRRALAPIDPPADLADRVETTLADLTVLLRARRSSRRRGRAGSAWDAAERALHDVCGETRRLLDDELRLRR